MRLFKYEEGKQAAYMPSGVAGQQHVAIDFACPERPDFPQRYAEIISDPTLFRSSTGI
jgi:hypothetical protein